MPVDRPGQKHEPYNLHEWAVPGREGRLFTCGRPGRGTFDPASEAQVPDDILHHWVAGLPQATLPLHLVSLLGRKATGISEFIYYPFRSAAEVGSEPTLHEWLADHYPGRFVVDEYPTTDHEPIARERAEEIGSHISALLAPGQAVVLFDSAGVVRCRAIRKALRAQPAEA